MDSCRRWWPISLTLLLTVAVIDYDTDGFETDELRHITQSDGSKAKALVVEHCVEAAGIDLNDVFQHTE